LLHVFICLVHCICSETDGHSFVGGDASFIKGECMEHIRGYHPVFQQSGESLAALQNSQSLYYYIDNQFYCATLHDLLSNVVIKQLSCQRQTCTAIVDARNCAQLCWLYMFFCMKRKLNYRVAILCCIDFKLNFTCIFI